MVAAIFTPQQDGLSGQFADGLPTTMADVYEAARRETLTGHTLIARHEALEQAVDARFDRIKAATGIAIDNPYRVSRQVIDDESYGRASFGGVRRSEYEASIAAMRQRMADLAVQFPDKADLFRDFDEADLARGQVKENERTLADVSARGPGGGATFLATLAGGFVGTLQDPLQLAGNILAPGAGAGRSLLYHGLKSAAINAGVEASIQPFVQAWRKEAGVEAGFGKALEDIAMAGAFGGALDVAGRGALRTVRVLRGGDWIEVPRTPENVGQALDDAARALPEGHPIREAAEGRPEKLAAEIEALGDKAPPALRALAQRADDDILFGAPEGMDEIAHIEGLAQAVRRAVSPDTEPPGFSGVRSPDLEAAVAAGAVPEDLAALVARSAPAERQMELAEMLMERRPATPDAARAMLADELGRPAAVAPDETRLGVRGFETPTADGVKLQTEALAREVIVDKPAGIKSKKAPPYTVKAPDEVARATVAEIDRAALDVDAARIVDVCKLGG